MVFREVLTATGEVQHEPPPGRLKRHLVERALTRCEHSDIDDIDPLVTLLRRFATKAAREDARTNCERLPAEDASADEVAAA